MYAYEFDRDRNNEFLISIDAGLSVKKHFHNCMEFVYVMDGGTLVHIDGEQFKLSPGEMCAVSCFSTHYYEQTQTGQYIVCLIPHRFFRDYISIFNSKSFQKPIIADICEKPLLNIFRMAFHLSFDHNIFGEDQTVFTMKAMETQLYYLSSYLINLCIRYCGLHERHRISSLAADAVRIIENNFKEDLTVKTISQKLGCYQKNLSYHFKTTMNMTIINYLNRTRVMEAARLLRLYPQMTVEAVMMESGFKSNRNFLRHFKNVFHCTPTEYKNQQNE